MEQFTHLSNLYIEKDLTCKIDKNEVISVFVVERDKLVLLRVC